MTDPQRRDELAADRVLFGLSAEEEAELRECGGAVDDVYDDEGWERAASATTLAFLRGRLESPPDRLLRQLEGQAMRFLTEEHGLRLQNVLERLDEPAAPARTATAAPPRGAPWVSYLLTAAALLLAGFLWWTREAPVATAAEQRLALLGESSLLRLDWNSGPGQPTGDVVWSDARQEGYMRLRGLPKNDASRAQYQLWIFDKQRDAAKPVDGGVFDISADGEVIVPIRAKIKVHEGQAFAVTVEKPGGVVVSEREQIVAVAGL